MQGDPPARRAQDDCRSSSPDARGLELGLFVSITQAETHSEGNFRIVQQREEEPARRHQNQGIVASTSLKLDPCLAFWEDLVAGRRMYE